MILPASLGLETTILCIHSAHRHSPFIMSTPIKKKYKNCSVWEAVRQNQRQNFNRAGWATKGLTAKDESCLTTIFGTANLKQWQTIRDSTVERDGDHDDTMNNVAFVGLLLDR